MSICLFTLTFQALADIKTLPRYHGARWAALLHFACNIAKIDIKQVVAGCIPLRNGQQPVQKGEYLTVRLLCPETGLAQLGDMLSCLHGGLPTEGAFQLGTTLRLEAVHDAVSGMNIGVHGEYSLRSVPLQPAYLDAETDAFTRLHSWHLRFPVPLRLTLPEGYKSGDRRYATPDFFQGDVLRHFLVRLRHTEQLAINPPDVFPTLIQSVLHWEDMRYNQNKHTALGGVTGELCFQGAPSLELAKLLVWGQYFGAGKNPRFGLGYYTLPELCSHRRILPWFTNLELNANNSKQPL